VEDVEDVGVAGEQPDVVELVVDRPELAQRRVGGIGVCGDLRARTGRGGWAVA
jgi:hypothetical protein